MPLCLPPRRGMGQRSPLMSPEMMDHCSNSLISQKTKSEEHVVEPSAPTPGSLLFNDEEQSDVVLLVGLEPKIWRFPGHSFILATASPVFQAMFGSPEGMMCSDWSISSKENQQEGSLCKQMETMKVDIPDIDPTVFHNLLRFVYTREVRISSVRDTLNILYAANKYMIFDLVHICLDYVKNNLNPSNVLSVYQSLCPCIKRGGQQETCHDSENQQNELLVRCTNMIDMHAEQILRQDDFSNLESEVLHEILSRNTLQVRSEMSVHEAVMMWACQECKRQRKELIAANKTEVLGKSIYCVRYLLMTADEFVSGPCASGLLPEEDKELLLARIREGEQASKEPLPFHLCDKNLDVKRTSLSKTQSQSHPCSQKPTITYPRNHNANSNQNGRKKTTTVKRVLQGLGDVVICFIQILD